MKDYELYVILDRELLGERDLVRTAEELVNNGIKTIQYRDKISSLEEIRNNSFRLKKVNIPVLIINDYPDIAKEVDANGVHLGQKDLGVVEARAVLGKDKIIGRSTGDIREAQEAQKQGVDYIGIGPVFHTSTKKNIVPIGLDVVREVVEAVTIPVVAVGGINFNNIDKVLAVGVKKIAMASAIFETKENFSWDRYKKHLEAVLQKR